jgi:hypothetical protein
VVVLPPDYPAQEHRELVVVQPPDYPAQEHRELEVVLQPDYPVHRSTGNWWWSDHLIIQHTGAQETGGCPTT